MLKSIIFLLEEVEFLAAKSFWYSTMGDLNWEKANTSVHKYCINIKIK